MNKVIKGLAVIFIAGGVITACTSVDTTEGTNTKPTEQKADKTATVDYKAGYDKVVAGDVLTGEGGSTYEEVIALLGKPTDETESTSTGINGEEVKQVYANWFSFTEGSVSITFTNGKASHKMYTK